MNSSTGSEAMLAARAQETPQEVIRLEGVTVRYRAPQERIGTLKEYAIRWMQGKIRHQTFDALQGVDLAVHKGEVFGLIGQNGAGKSTLLKLIARVLRPTTGRVWVKGRVAPLLEVGAGFHPELTGRENVMLNGAMLGFSRQEMQAKFNQIIDFSELWDFIDAPLRTYSSGMWARLGFAVATDVDPDILIVDEILSVGDEAFQRKSAERMEAFRERGITILLVSHNMALIESMCQRAAWMERGRVITVGPARSVVDRYLGRVGEDEFKRLAHNRIPDPSRRWGSRIVEITRVRILDQQAVEQAVFHTGQELALEIEFLAHEPVDAPIIGMAIHRLDGVHVSGPNTSFAGLDLGRVEGTGVVTYTIPRLPLLEGRYDISVAVTNREDTEIFDYHDRVYPIRVQNRGQETKERFGLMTLQGEWRKA